MHSASRLSRRFIVASLLILAFVPPLAADEIDLEKRAELLADKLEIELSNLCSQTVAFGRVPALKRQEHWYRPWQENAIVQVMDRALDNFGELLLSELVDPKGQLAAANAHAGSGAPVQSGDLYLVDFREREWFKAVVAAGPEASPRLDGPVSDPDIARAYGPELNPCLRVTSPVVVDGELVAILSQCFRYEPVSTLLDQALEDGDHRIAGDLALFDGRGRLIAGRDPQAGGAAGFRTRAFNLELAGGKSWTLRSFEREGGGLAAFLSAIPLPSLSPAVLGRLPLLFLGVSVCVVLGLLVVARLRGRDREEPAPVEPRAATLNAADAPSRRPLLPSEKAYELLGASLGAMLGTLRALADGAEDLSSGSLNPAVAEGPGSTLHALRRMEGLKELLAGLQRHVTNCRGGGESFEGRVSTELRRGMEIFGRVGRQMGDLVEPLLETERRLMRLPSRGLRGPGETRNFKELTENLDKLVGVMSALQGCLSRLPRASLRDEWTADANDGGAWERAIDETHDLLILLASQSGATTKLLQLLPAATDPVIEVEDISAKVLGASATGSAVTMTPVPVSTPAPTPAREAAAVAGGSFEILGGRKPDAATGGGDGRTRLARLPSR